MGLVVKGFLTNIRISRKTRIQHLEDKDQSESKYIQDKPNMSEIDFRV